jgi:hypothetical protein
VQRAQERVIRSWVAHGCNANRQNQVKHKGATCPGQSRQKLLGQKRVQGVHEKVGLKKGATHIGESHQELG